MFYDAIKADGRVIKVGEPFTFTGEKVKSIVRMPEDDGFGECIEVTLEDHSFFTFPITSIVWAYWK